MVANRLFSIYAPDGVAWAEHTECYLLCAECGAEYRQPVNNHAVNALLCPQCGNTIEQFVTASPATIRPNTAIVAANLHSVGTSLPEFGQMRIYNQLDVINSQDEPVIQVCRLGEPNSPPFFEHRTPLLTPPRNFASWQMSCLIPVSFFPRRECRVLIELNVANTWGNQLAQTLKTLNTVDLFRRLIQAEFKLLAAEQPALAHEFRQMEMNANLRNGRYTPLVLQLMDYLLTR